MFAAVVIGGVAAGVEGTVHHSAALDQLAVVVTVLAPPFAVLLPLQALVDLRRVRKSERSVIEMVSRRD